MDRVSQFLPSAEKGYLPYFLAFISVVSIGNALQNLATLHYTRRIYNGKFVPSTTLPKASVTEDRTDKLVAIPAGKPGNDQVTPLAARLFGTYTFCVGLIRLYAAYGIENRLLYQLGIWTYVVAAGHFTSEMLVYKTIRFSGPQIFPFLTAYAGMAWMFTQYNNYVVV